MGTSGSPSSKSPQSSPKSLARERRELERRFEQGTLQPRHRHTEPSALRVTTPEYVESEPVHCCCFHWLFHGSVKHANMAELGGGGVYLNYDQLEQKRTLNSNLSDYHDVL
eukprot:TRINITY_DN17558_c0_g1_i6.p1 TRINITY_DN17558_c0_g1~~TRINITY_DN17558_c0_g1_i6.p1  ORF type:complete len:111 (+),score=8.00 TRINITY_DN17558_c0_g1_i6:225-557(+)